MAITTFPIATLPATASNVVNVPSGTVSANNVQIAINQLAGMIPTTAGQIANVPTAPVTAINVQAAINQLATLTSNALAVSPEQFGATDPGADSYVGFSAAITAAVAGSGRILLSDRIYLTSQTLDFQNLTVEGSANNSEIKALTVGMLVVKNGALRHVGINGDGKAAWGWLVNGTGAFTPSGVRGDTLNILNCIEYGFVNDQLQNATFIGMYCQKNGIANMVIANGSKNCSYYNCTISSVAGSFPSACNLLLLLDTSNPHGFGLSTSITIPNDHHHFWGGIMEGVALNNVKTLNPAASAQSGGEINFHNYEFDGPRQITFDSTYAGIINFFDCGIQGDGSGAPLASGTGNGAEVFFYNYSHQATPSAYGTSGVDFGMTCNNNLSKLLSFSLNNFAASPPFAAFGPLTITYTASVRSLDIACTAGSGHIVFQDSAAAIGWRASAAQRKPLVRITFFLSAIVGGTQIEMDAEGSGTVIGTYVAGFNEAFYQFKTTDNGRLSWWTGIGVTAWSLSNVTIEYL